MTSPDRRKLQILALSVALGLALLGAWSAVKLGLDNDPQQIFKFDDEVYLNHLELVEKFPHTESSLALILEGPLLERGFPGSISFHTACAGQAKLQRLSATIRKIDPQCIWSANTQLFTEWHASHEVVNF